MNWNSVFPAKWIKSPSSTVEELEKLKSLVQFPLTSEFIDLYRWANGGEGDIGPVYLQLWSTENIPSYNGLYKFRDGLPEVLVFGYDSSCFYGFDYGKPTPDVIRFSAGFNHPSSIETREPSLEVLLNKLREDRL